MKSQRIAVVGAVAALLSACTEAPVTSGASQRPPSTRLSSAEYGELARNVLTYVRRVSTAERSPAIQSAGDALERSLLAGYRKLDSTQALQLQDEILIDSTEPKIAKLVDGALLADDFNSDGIDLYRWQVQRQREGLQVEQAEGTLRVHGAPVGATGLGPGFSGLVSKTFADVDVELVARVRVDRAPPETGVGEHLAFVHLCGTQPDWFAHVEVGKRRGFGDARVAVMRRFLAAEGLVRKVDLPFRTGEWLTVRIRHEGSRNATNVWVDSESGRRHALTDATMFYSSSKVELNVLDTLEGTAVDARFDDCRFYRTAASTPLVVQVLSLPGLGRPLKEIRVRAAVLGSAAPPSEATSDSRGRCELQLPADIAYPVQVRFTAYYGEELLLDKTTPEVAGVRGVYPGDVWLVILGLTSEVLPEADAADGMDSTRTLGVPEAPAAPALPDDGSGSAAPQPGSGSGSGSGGIPDVQNAPAGKSAPTGPMPDAAR